MKKKDKVSDGKTIEMKLKRKFTNALELPKEIMLNLPLITIVGNQELTVENYKGIIEYSEDKIRLSTSTGIVKIEGKKLVIKQITAENMAITGTVTKFEYLL